MKMRVGIFAAILCVAITTTMISSCKGNNKPLSSSNSASISKSTDVSSGLSSEPSSESTTSESTDGTSSDTISFEEVKTTGEASKFIEDFKGKTYYTHFKTASKLYWINADRLTNAERNMMLSLQGIVAQQQSEIFLYYSYNKLWFDALQEYYGITFEEVASPWEMVEKYKSRLQNNGYVRYIEYDSKKVYLDNPTAPSSVNNATTISGVERYLVVEDSLVETAKQHGLVERADGTDYYEIEVFYEYMNRLNKDVFTSIRYDETNLRDMSVALKTMVWRDKNIDDLSYMLEQMNPNGMILGWHDSEGEGVLAGTLLSYGTIATDHSNNFTVYAGLPKQIFKQKPPARYELKGRKDVHYITFVMSDGDNIMWIDRNFAYDKNYFGAPNRGAIPFGWSISASLPEFSPLFIQYLYKTATVNDNFVGALGYGYMYPLYYPADKLDEYCRRTAEYMKAMNMSYTTILDWDDDIQPMSYKSRMLGAFSQYSSIKGGFLQYGVNRYVSPLKGGGIYWSNGKPFVNIRDSLAPEDWSKEGHDAARSWEVVTQMAYRLNSYKRDCTVIEGYSAINVHPWTMSYGDAVNLVNLLDENVVVVSPTEFMELIAKNVKKVDKPILDDVKTFDYSKMPTANIASYLELEKVKLKTATNRLSFDFETDGTQGWNILAGKQELDQAWYSLIADNKRGIMFAGSNFGMKSTEPNAIAYNKINLPNKTTLKMKVRSNATTSKTRVQIIDKNSKIETIYAWTDWTTGGSTVYEIDLSKYAGQTVTISLQFGDSGTNNGSSAAIDDIVIE